MQVSIDWRASTISAITSGSASTQPTRRPGARIFENVCTRDHARAPGAELAQAGQVLALEAQQAVRVVLEHDRAPLGGELDQALAALAARASSPTGSGTSGSCRSASAAPCAAASCASASTSMPSSSPGDLDHLALVAGDRRRPVRVRRRLDGDEVARPDEQLADEVEPLHAAGGDQQLFGRDGRPLRGEERRSAPRAARGRPRSPRSRTPPGHRPRARAAASRRSRSGSPRAPGCPSRGARCRGSARRAGSCWSRSPSR